MAGCTCEIIYFIETFQTGTLGTNNSGYSVVRALAGQTIVIIRVRACKATFVTSLAGLTGTVVVISGITGTTSDSVVGPEISRRTGNAIVDVRPVTC